MVRGKCRGENAWTVGRGDRANSQGQAQTALHAALGLWRLRGCVERGQNSCDRQKVGRQGLRSALGLSWGVEGNDLARAIGETSRARDQDSRVGNAAAWPFGSADVQETQSVRARGSSASGAAAQDVGGLIRGDWKILRRHWPPQIGHSAGALVCRRRRVHGKKKTGGGIFFSAALAESGAESIA